MLTRTEMLEEVKSMAASVAASAAAAQVEETKVKQTRKKSKVKMESEQKSDFSLKGKKLEQQREIVKEAIDFYQKELEKWHEKLQEVNDKIDDRDWKLFTERFSIEEINRRLQLQGNQAP